MYRKSPRVNLSLKTVVVRGAMEHTMNFVRHNALFDALVDIQFLKK